MTTDVLDRPLSQVDETAQRIQGSTGAGGYEAAEAPAWDMRRLRQLAQRASQDPWTLLLASIVAAAVAAFVAAAVVNRRPAPRTAEDLLLERSREAFDRARATLETITSKLASLER
jgi:hypothetical protein